MNADFSLILFHKPMLRLVLFLRTQHDIFSVPFLAVVQQKADLEKEAKLSILEAGVADVSTSVYFFHFQFKSEG